MTTTTGLSTEMIEMVLETLGEVLQRHLSDERILELDAQDEFPVDVVRELLSPDVGMHLLFLPEEVGGLGGGASDVCRVSEAMAAVDLGVATAFLAIFLGAEPILVGGTPAQKQHWLTQVAEKGWIVAYCVTEPGAGSNVAALQSTAERILGEDGEVTGYRLNGTKQFITNGSVADLYTVMARTPDGPSFFIIEKGTPGLDAGKKEEKHGIRASNTTSVVLQDVVVPVSHLVGEVEGDGLKQGSAVFGRTRLMVGSFGLGAGRTSLVRAARYARERIQFGTPLIAKEGYALKLLVPHWVDLCAGRAYVEEVAGRLDAQAKDLPVQGAIAKYWSTEAGNRAADAAVQALGGYGYTREYMVEKFRRDVRITSIYEGTSEILQSIVGMSRWKDHVRSKGRLYREAADTLDALHAERPDVGAAFVATAARALAAVLDYAQSRRLPKHQIVLFAMADLCTRVEVAAAFCRRAATTPSTATGEAAVTPTMCRVFAREALAEVPRVGRRCASGFTAADDAEGLEAARALVAELAPAEDVAGHRGQWLDMAEVAAWMETADE